MDRARTSLRRGTGARGRGRRAGAAPGRGLPPPQVTAAQQGATAALAQLAGAQSRANELVLTAPRSGVVLLVNYRAGELVPPSMPVVTLGDPDSLWMRVYVAAPKLTRVRLGAPVEVRPIGSSQPFHGHVVSIATEAEFTPRAALTEEEQANLVFGVKLVLDRTGGTLKAGLPADARILTSAAAGGARAAGNPGTARRGARENGEARPPERADVVEVRDLVKRFGKVIAVDHVSFSIHPGEIFGILGPERLGQDHHDPHALRPHPPDAGHGDRGGRRRVARARAREVAHRLHVAVVRPLPRPERGREPRVLRRRLHARREVQAAARWAKEAMRLGELGDRLAGVLSGGQKQRLALGVRDDARAGGGVPGRAHGRRGSGRSAAVLDHHPRAGRRGRDDDRDDALHGRGRAIRPAGVPVAGPPRGAWGRPPR